MIKITTRPFVAAIPGAAFLFALSLAPARIAHAVITTFALYSTGQSSVYSAGTQTQFSSGALDTPWTIISTPSTTTPATALVTKPNSGWAPDTTTSQWISNLADSTGFTSASGNYDYQESFNLAASMDMSTVQIQFNLAVDDSVTSVLINGKSTGIVGGTYNAFTGTETINASNATFNVGTNKIDFVVNNIGSGTSPTGLNVLFTSATANVTPEPSSVCLLFLGVSGVIARYRRRPRGLTTTARS